MYLLRIAFRNILRRRGRNFIIAGILIMAAIFFLFMESLMGGLMDITFGMILDFETPHIEIGQERFFTEAKAGEILPLEEAFVLEEEMLTAIRSADGFMALTPVLDFSADFIAGRYEFPVRVRAIAPDNFRQVFRNHEYLAAGEFVEANDSGIVIGDQLARFFDLEVGDFYTLRFQDRQGSYNTMQGEVKGIVSVPHSDMNLGTVFVARDQASLALGVEAGAVSQIMIRMGDRKQAITQANIWREQSGDSDFQVRSYRDAADLLVLLEGWGYQETYAILFLFLLVGAIGIVCVIILGAIERVREIGIMKAMGLKESQIVRIFLIEAGGIGALGGLIGCACGAVLVFLFKTYGMNMAAFVDLKGIGIPLGDKIYGAYSFSSFVLIFVFVVITAVVSSIVPAYWAARKDPMEAIRHK